MHDVIRCPRLDARLGPRALTAALVHLIATRGHASCSSDRIALAAITSLVATRADLQSATSSLRTAVELLEEAADRDASSQTRWLSKPEVRKAHTWN